MSAVVLPDRIEGRRLVLRRWQPEDVETLAVLVAHNVEHLQPWMPWIADEPLSWRARLDLVEKWEGQRQQGGDVVLAIEWDGAAVGGSGLHRRRGPRTLEIGYWVDKDHLRQGIATETAAMLTTAALAVPGIGSVEIHHDRANVASAGVPKRLGYRFVGERADTVQAPGEMGVDCAWRMESSHWQPEAVAAVYGAGGGRVSQ